MTAKKIKTVEADRAQYINYQKKAEEFYMAMLQAEKSGHWNAVGLNAVHCAISMADALLVKFAGIRSISNDHMVVVEVIKQNLDVRDMQNKLNSLLHVLAKKSLIEYDSVPFSKNDASDIAKQAERFYLWVRGELLR
ncbi:MAG: hypothetical protein COZ98_01655 [Candidatus Omnitrophica bacterium CG_4_8_14_3_um_filter_43_15]|nr:MAG: hypothetical protein COZ98_01655 [Candidatus Omnitrophica bacterium CG_4_8_14_3_um_filter_43_15]